MKENKKQFARTLRKEQTKAEKIVWELIRKRKFKNFKFRRQHVVEGFILDFFCHELRLGIEIDGGIHLKRKDYDEMRQEIIELEDIKIIRITNKEIAENKRSILKRIEEAIR
ncbi:MAG: endonuclease domain-containing protein [Candidatus Margulisiibacteriota bacterium]